MIFYVNPKFWIVCLHLFLLIKRGLHVVPNLKILANHFYLSLHQSPYQPFKKLQFLEHFMIKRKPTYFWFNRPTSWNYHLGLLWIFSYASYQGIFNNQPFQYFRNPYQNRIFLLFFGPILNLIVLYFNRILLLLWNHLHCYLKF